MLGAAFEGNCVTLFVVEDLAARGEEILGLGLCLGLSFHELEEETAF
jgi:hypothetical protein